MNTEPEKSFNFWTEEEKEELSLSFPVAGHTVKMALSLVLCLGSFLFVAYSFVYVPQENLEKTLNEKASYENRVASLSLEQTWAKVQACREIHQAKNTPAFAKFVEKRWQDCEKSLSAFYSNPDYNTLLKQARSAYQAHAQEADYTKAFYNENAANFWKEAETEKPQTRSLYENWEAIQKALKLADPLQDSEMDPDLNLEKWTFEKGQWTLLGTTNEVAKDPLGRLGRFQEELEALKLFSKVSLKSYDKEKKSFHFELES